MIEEILETIKELRVESDNLSDRYTNGYNAAISHCIEKVKELDK